MQSFNYVVVPLTTRSLTREDQELLDKLARELGDKHVHTPISRVSEFRIPEEETHLLVLIFLSGGVSRTAVQLQLLLKTPTIMFAHQEDNSLASALGVLERQLVKKPLLLVQYSRGEVEKTVQDIKQMVHVCKAAYETYTGTFAILFEDGVKLEWIPFLRRTRIKLKFIREVEYDRSSYDKFIESFTSAIREIFDRERVDGVTLDCFRLLRELKMTPCLAYAKLLAECKPIACECDIVSLFSQVLLRKISDEYFKRSMIVNVLDIDVDAGRVTVAHCTAPLTMSDKWELDAHFETGFPSGVRVYIPAGTGCTLFRVSSDFRYMYVVRGVVETSTGDLRELRACLTRARIRLDKKKYVRGMRLGNHHILVLSREVAPFLKIAGWYLGLKILGEKPRLVMRSPFLN